MATKVDLLRAAASGPYRGRPLDPRNNSLNLIRLVLAWLVLVAHAYHIVGAGNGPTWRGENLGGWAVIGFFGISGYLITASRFNNRLGPYLLHRIARIFPAFIVCLVVTAFLFAPIAYGIDHGSLRGFMSTPTTPLDHIFVNSGLKINSYDISGTPANVPYPKAWNGSLWTLYYEFICYLLVALLGTFAIVKNKTWPMAVAFLASVALWAVYPWLKPLMQSNYDFELAARLTPYFLGGALVQVLSKRIGMNMSLGLSSWIAAFAIVFLVPNFGAQLAAPFIAYGLLWTSTWLPAPRIILRHDVSYGAYIYAFPVQQLLVVFGAAGLGVAWNIVLATAGTALLATASWLLLERPIMRRARKSTA